MNKPKKNINILSFQEETEDEPQSISKVIVSSHDILNDPHLKKETALNLQEIETKRQKKREEELKLQSLKDKVKQKDIHQEQQNDINIYELQQQPKKKVKVNIQETLGMIDEEERELLKYKAQRDESGNQQIVWQSSSSSSSSSESEYSDKEQQRIRQQQKEQYDKLKAEVLQFKQYEMGTLNPKKLDRISHDKKLMTNVEQRRYKYLMDMRNSRHEKEITDKLLKFRQKLHSQEVQKDRNHWMNHKLKFHIDSVTAFSVHENKEKASDVLGQQVQNKNIKDLLKLSE